MVYLRKIDSLDQLVGISDEWRLLIDQSGVRMLPLTYDWIVEWWKSFGERAELCVFLFYVNDSLVAIAPFIKKKVSRYGLTVTSLELMANGHVPFSNFILDPLLGSQKLDDLLQSFIESQSADVIVFKKIAKSGALAAEIEKLTLKKGGRVGRSRSIQTPIIEIDQKWEIFWSARPKKFRASMRNKLNKFKKDGQFTVSKELLVTSSDPFVKQMIEISKHSWKSDIGNDLGSNAAGRNFLMGLIDKFGPAGFVSLWMIRKAGEPIAFELHVLHNRVVYPLRADFHERYRKDSPGALLEYFAIKSIFEDDLADEYYSCGDSYKYLLNWTNKIEKHVDIELFSETHKAKALYFLEYKAKPALRPCYSMYKRIKQRLSWS